MSQQEDDLRALAKIMDFLRAVSIILVVMNVYWFCYEAIRLWGVDIGVVDRILMNFNRTAGLFRSILYTKLFAVLLLALSCLGTKGVKGEKITWGRIWTALAVGFVLFFLNWWILALPLPIEAVTGLYILTVGAGYVCLLMGGLWMSRLLKHNLMDDVFNNENESFMQETRLIESEYSVNLPTRFYYKKRWNNGWINVVNPFRASIVLGTPGSGKSYAVVNNFIKQQIERGFSMYVYDFKFSDLSTMSVGDCWPLALATLGVVMIGKPLAAYVVVRCLRRPVPLALSVSVALAQVGEFSFILAGIGLMYNILPPDANQAIILAAVVSISLKPILYRQIGPAVKWLQKRGIGLADPGGVNSMALPAPDARRVVLVGFGPTGRILKRILNDNGVEVIIVEMNIDTVTAIREQGGDIVYGDASQREILRHAGIEYAESLILSASIPDAKEIVGVALELNPHIDVMIHTKYMRDVDILKEAGASQVFSSESEVALSMAEYFLREGGADDEQIVSERQRIRAELDREMPGVSVAGHS